VLQLVITEHLYSLFPREAEGRLTKLRSRLVSREALRAHASQLELGQFLMMGRGEEASGGRGRTSTLADAFEALLGAIYLDTDLATARRFVLTLAADDLAQLDAEPIDLNPKGHLQEVLQAISPTSPVYELLAESGPEHEKTFVVRVSWEGMALGEGSGRSKKQAETAAALQAVRRKPWEQTATLEEIQANQAASASSA
jgi:ribonuclease-3